MKYSRNAVYTRVHDTVTAARSGIYVTGKLEAVPPRSPAVMIQETGRIHNPEAATFGNLQPVWTSTFETQVYSSRENGGLSECYDILDIVTAAFVKLGYLLIYQSILENGENKKYRLVARFRRVCGANDQLPEEENGT